MGYYSCSIKLNAESESVVLLRDEMQKMYYVFYYILNIASEFYEPEQFYKNE